MKRIDKSTLISKVQQDERDKVGIGVIDIGTMKRFGVLWIDIVEFLVYGQKADC